MVHKVPHQGANLFHHVAMMIGHMPRPEVPVHHRNAAAEPYTDRSDSYACDNLFSLQTKALR